MIKYNKTIEFNGDTSSAMTTAKNFFISNGFKLELRGDDTLLLKGPGMISNRQNAIRGVSKGQLQITSSSIVFTGDLGGVEFMKKFVCFFPPLLILGLTATLSIVFYLTNQFSVEFLAFALLIIPWLIIGPLVGRSIQRRTENAIDTLLENLTM